MTDQELEAWLDAAAVLLGLSIEPEWRDTVRLHLRIISDLAHRLMEFPLPDDAEPAPVFRP